MTAVETNNIITNKSMTDTFSYYFETEKIETLKKLVNEINSLINDNFKINLTELSNLKYRTPTNALALIIEQLAASNYSSWQDNIQKIISRLKEIKQEQHQNSTSEITWYLQDLTHQYYINYLEELVNKTSDFDSINEIKSEIDIYTKKYEFLKTVYQNNQISGFGIVNQKYLPDWHKKTLS